ncbi:disease resistance protein RPM1-like [Typha latifolia]|uniref:disease resistance protein RPM1-like n=1 Tax=Typha latifolia TaxID=4733 RepID=UPI003C2F6D47
MRELLSDKKFLIVLDDVWAPAEFLHLMNALRGNNRGSRIIVTSRIDDVAQLATDDRYRLTIEPLGADPAFLLFCRKAFWKTESRECPSELEECARAIVAECEGLPLAIASMGLFLSSKEQTLTEWTQISEQLDWEWNNNPSLTRTKCVLNISYKALPRYLKNCFLYCSIFPEDYLLSRKKLTRLWIAEGLVEERGPNKTLEEVAESYLKELVGRSMLQLVKKNHFGRVKKFRMHDLVRDLAISLSREECFHQVYTGGENVRIHHDARRLSLLSCSDTDDKSGIDLPRLRSLIAFDTKMSPSLLLSSVSSKSRYLAVLDLTGLPIETLPDSIGDLFNLRYLGLRCCSNVKSLPKSIGKLSYLQTLDLFGTGIRKLPACIVKCNKLRHLYATQEIDTNWELFIHGLGVEAPGDVWKLKDLQTFEAVEANGELVGKLARLSQLRTLWIYKLQRTHCAKLCESLSQMNLLSYLFLFASNEHEILELDNLNTASPTLHRLVLKGRLSNGTFNSPLFNGQNNCSLQYINLSWCQLTQLEENQDLIRVLSKLPNLKELILQNVYVGEQDLQFPAGGFALLECLTLRTMPKIAQLRIEGGAMTSLKRLELDGLQGLRGSPAGIESLQSLKELHLYDVNCCEEIRRRFAGTGRTIPRIYS